MALANDSIIYLVETIEMKLFSRCQTASHSSVVFITMLVFLLFAHVFVWVRA